MTPFSFAAAACAALLSMPAAAQQGYAPDQVCAELGDVMHAAALGAADTRLNHGSFPDAQATAQALAGDKLDLLAEPLYYSIVSDMVDGLVVDIYRMPRSNFSGGTHSDVPWQVADQARTVAQANCLQGFRQG